MPDRRTRAIASPPYAGPAPRPREDWTRDYLQAVAVAGVHDSFALVGSRDHVEAICVDYCAIADELLAARDRLQALTLELEAARDQRAADLAEANRQRDIAIRMSDENHVLRIQAGLNTLAIAVTGRTAAEPSAEHADMDRRDRARAVRLEAERQAIAAIGSLAAGAPSSGVDIEVVLERASVRVIRSSEVHERFADVLERRVSRLARGSQVTECLLDDETVAVSAEVLA